MRTLHQLEDLATKRVLVRVDFNVPLDSSGTIADDGRIRAALPTVELLRERRARVILASHLDRPQGPDPRYSLAPVAERLSELLGAEVKLAPAVVGGEVETLVDALAPGEVLLLENVRFEPGETANDPALANALAALAEVYVDDAFGAVHRAHASTVGVPERLRDHAAGLLLEREVSVLSGLLEQPERPLVAVLGGSKVSDKIKVIERLLAIADEVLIGGALAFPFLRAQGHAIGASKCPERDVEVAAELLADQAATSALRLPLDLIAADRLAADATVTALPTADVPDRLIGLDIGPRTAASYAEVIGQAATVFWNGPMGAFELAPFAAGTLAIADAMANSSATTVIGGGDSAAAVHQLGLAGRITHISTGGGAALELIEGRDLPGVEVLA